MTAPTATDVPIAAAEPTVDEVVDGWLSVAAKRSMFSAEELIDMLLDIRNAGRQRKET